MFKLKKKKIDNVCKNKTCMTEVLSEVIRTAVTPFQSRFDIVIWY